MERITLDPRPQWISKVEQVGLTYHTHENGLPYWNEGACYRVSMEEVDRLERATQDLYDMVLKATEWVITNRAYPQLHIPEGMIAAIEESWETDAPSVYGRFDLGLGVDGGIKLFECNFDTPTSLVEAAVIQWHWQQERFPSKDQWNSIHERLEATWKGLRDYLPMGPVSFVSQDSAEDWMTTTYMREVAAQAGLQTKQFAVEEIGLDELGNFIDLEGQVMPACFKLYPHEFMAADAFGRAAYAVPRRIHWIEPSWKALLSSKGILEVLWRLFPGHPLLLETRSSDPGGMRDYVRKPVFGREGSNIQVVRGGSVALSTSGNYDQGASVYQQFHELQAYQGVYPVIGSWVIGGEAAGMGIREGGLVTSNLCQFTPHFIGDPA